MRVKNIPYANAVNKVLIEEMGFGWSKNDVKKNNVNYLEIGIGKGSFIAEHARSKPKAIHYGIEIYNSIIISAFDKLLKDYPDVNNVRIMNKNAKELVEFFPDNSLDRIYLNFSDPWHKKKHSKRRLTSSTYIYLYRKLLKKDGKIIFKTDNDKFFDWTCDFLKSIDVHIVAISKDLYKDSRYQEYKEIKTDYESKWLSKGKNINFAIFQF